jgi:hypothetical protein
MLPKDYVRLRLTGEHAVAAERDEALDSQPLLDRRCLWLAAAVVPEDRRAQRAIVGPEGDEAVHLAGQPDPVGAPRAELAEDRFGGGDPRLGILL